MPSAGADSDGACTPRAGDGAASLCAAWRDPDFDAKEIALYYARVIERPSCRWSHHLCHSRAIDCTDTGSVPAELAYCCDADVPKTIRERAWTSPIFYTPPS